MQAAGREAISSRVFWGGGVISLYDPLVDLDTAADALCIPSVVWTAIST